MWQLNLYCARKKQIQKKNVFKLVLQKSRPKYKQLLILVSLRWTLGVPCPIMYERLLYVNVQLFPVSVKLYILLLLFEFRLL